MDRKELAEQYVENCIKGLPGAKPENVCFSNEHVQEAFIDGMDAVIKEIESLYDRPTWLESHRISIWRKLQELKDNNIMGNEVRRSKE